MLLWLEMLAAAVKRIVHYLARKAGAAASALTLVIMSVFLSGCAAVTNKNWGDVFISIGKLVGILPDVEVISPFDFAMAWLKERFGEAVGPAFEQLLLKLVTVPQLQEGFFGQIGYVLSFVGFILTLAFVGVYISRLRKYARKAGSYRKVKEGYTALIPPQVYLQKRFLPVLLVVLLAPAVVQFMVNITHKIVIDFAKAVYLTRGETVGSTIFTAITNILEGGSVWDYVGLFFLVFPLGLVFLGFLQFRYLSIFVYYARMMFQVPVFLNGTNYRHIAEPIHLIVKRVVVLGISWLVIILGPAAIVEIHLLGFTGTSVLLLVILGGIALPWILLSWWDFGEEWLEKKALGWFDDFDVYPVKSDVRLTAEEEPLYFLRHLLGVAGTQAVEHVKTADPAGYAAAQAITTQLPSRRKTASRGSTGPVSAGPSQQILHPHENIDELKDAAYQSGLHLHKDEIPDHLYAIEASLVAAGSASQDLGADAKAAYAQMTKQQRKFWERRGWRLKLRT